MHFSYTLVSSYIQTISGVQEETFFFCLKSQAIVPIWLDMIHVTGTLEFGHLFQSMCNNVATVNVFIAQPVIVIMLVDVFEQKANVYLLKLG